MLSKFDLAIVAALVVAGATSALGQNTPPPDKEPVNRLVSVLRSDASRKDKADACRELALIGTRDAVAALAALLPDPNLNHMARYGLETIPDPAVDEVLRRALTRVSGRPLVGVIGSIGVRHDAQAVELLAKFLSSTDAEVAQAAARAMGSIATPEAAVALQKAVAHAPSSHLLAFCEGLFRMAETFANQGDPAAALAIYRQVADLPVTHQIRAGALRGAILAHQKESLRLLMQGIGSDDFALVAAAARTALEMPGKEVTQALSTRLAQLPPDTQVLVIQILGKRGDASALPVLLPIAQSGPKAVRLAAIHAFAEVGCTQTLPTLLTLLGDADRDIAQSAQESLAGLPGPDVDRAVAAMLDSPETGRQLMGIDLVERRRMSACLPALLKMASQADAKVRPAALKRVGELAKPSDLPALLKLLTGAQSTPDLNAAEQAIAAVCSRGQDADACADQLTALLPAANTAQKSAVLRLLSGVGGGKSLQAVRGAVDDSNPDVHAAAVRALAAWKTAEVAPELLALAKDAGNPTDRMLYLRSYLGWADQPDLPEDQRLSFCQKAAGLIQGDQEVRLLLGALGNIPSAESVALIAPYLDVAATRNEASAALVTVSEKLLKAEKNAAVASKLIDPLRKAAQATNSDLAQRAKALLEQARKKADAK